MHARTQEQMTPSHVRRAVVCWSSNHMCLPANTMQEDHRAAKSPALMRLHVWAIKATPQSARWSLHLICCFIFLKERQIGDARAAGGRSERRWAVWLTAASHWHVYSSKWPLPLRDRSHRINYCSLGTNQRARRRQTTTPLHCLLAPTGDPPTKARHKQDPLAAKPRHSHDHLLHMAVSG